MKKFILTLVVAMAAFVGINAEKVQVRLYIPGMECNSCKTKIEKSLSYAKGIKGLECDITTRIATITFDDTKTNIEAIQKTLQKDTTFESKVVKGKKEGCSGCKDGKCTGACKQNGEQHKEGCNHDHSKEQPKTSCCPGH